MDLQRIPSEAPSHLIVDALQLLATERPLTDRVSAQRHG